MQIYLSQRSATSEAILIPGVSSKISCSKWLDMVGSGQRRFQQEKNKRNQL